MLFLLESVLLKVISSVYVNMNLSYFSLFQWVDCVSQLLRTYPFAFEFSSVCISLPCMTFARAMAAKIPVFDLLLYGFVSGLFRTGNLYYFIIQAFLVDFLDCVLSCRFGNFLCNRYSFLKAIFNPY